MHAIDSTVCACIPTKHHRNYGVFSERMNSSMKLPKLEALLIADSFKISTETSQTIPINYLRLSSLSVRFGPLFRLQTL